MDCLLASIQRSDTPAWLGKVGQVLGDGSERGQPSQRLDIAGETLAANHRDAGAYAAKPGFDPRGEPS